MLLRRTVAVSIVTLTTRSCLGPSMAVREESLDSSKLSYVAACNAEIVEECPSLLRFWTRGLGDFPWMFDTTLF